MDYTLFLIGGFLCIIAVAAIIVWRRRWRELPPETVSYSQDAINVAQENFCQSAAVAPHGKWFVLGESRVRLTHLADDRYVLERVFAWETWPPRAGQKVTLKVIMVDVRDPDIRQFTFKVVADDAACASDDMSDCNNVPSAYDAATDSLLTCHIGNESISPESLGRLAYQLVARYA